MNILYIWDADYPWDIRVEKICSSLANRGDNVHIAARNLKKLPEYELLSGLNIHRTKVWKNSKLNYALSFPAFFNPVWKKFLDRIISENNIDLIIVRDLPMAIAGIWAGKRNSIPVIFDMAEDYVSMLKGIWKRRKFEGLNLIVRNPYLAKIVEKYTFKRMDHILVVIDEAISVVKRAGGDIKKVTIVSNTPSINLFENQNSYSDENIEQIKNRYAAIYTGGIQMGRGIQVVFQAMAQIVIKIPDFLFVVIGDGYAREKIKAMISELGIEKYVLWVGWLDHKKLFSYIKASKLGLIPHRKTEHVDTTIPNKIFDYMGCGIPIVASDANPLKRIIEEENCGTTFKSFDVNDLAKAVCQVYDSYNAQNSTAISAIKTKYNWQIDEQRLFKAIDTCVKSV